MRVNTSSNQEIFSVADSQWSSVIYMNSCSFFLPIFFQCAAVVSGQRIFWAYISIDDISRLLFNLYLITIQKLEILCLCLSLSHRHRLWRRTITCSWWMGIIKMAPIRLSYYLIILLKMLFFSVHKISFVKLSIFNS